MIVFMRQPDNTFVKSGEFVKGTRAVCIHRDHIAGVKKDWKPQEAFEIVEGAITAGLAPAQEYRLVEMMVETVEVMDRREANLVKARATRAANKAAEREGFSVCPLCSGTEKTGHEKDCMNRGIELRKPEDSNND